MNPTTEIINVSVDVPPSVNHLYFSRPYTKDGRQHCRRILTKQGKDYKEAVGWIIKMAANHAGWTYHEGDRLSIGLTLVFKDNRRRDITNCIKIIEDAAAEVLGFDDAVVDAFFVRRAGIDKNNPHARLSIAKVVEPDIPSRRPPPTPTTLIG